tara:strand:+ start:326 stop:673 length:348 start_codon:yes stop_codon:yes gene_type:complete
VDNFDFLPAILSFVFVIGLLLAALWFLKARNLNGLGLSSGSIKILETARVDHKHKLVVVNYANRRLLLGVSQNQMSLLDNQALADMPENPGEEKTKPGGFKEHFDKLLSSENRNN